MDKGIYNKFLNMSSTELKKEYQKCDDSEIIKKKMLKKIIMDKKEITMKQYDEQQLQKNVDKQIDNLIRMKEMNEQKKQLSKMKEFEKIMKQRGNMEQYWESHKTVSKIDPLYKNEVENDFTNNKLMERLNCELDFRINDGQKTRDFIKPYDMTNEGNLLKDEDVPINNFSSKRLLH